MKATLTVEGIECHAYHGCLEEETAIGGNYRVDVWITADFIIPMQSDNLNDTVDYDTVTQIVISEMAKPSNLIEHVCSRILSSLQEICPRNSTIDVAVTKYNPPVKGNVEKTVFRASKQIS